MPVSPLQKRAATWLGIAVAAAVLLWLLAPVLTPFVVAAVLAYALAPLVDRLDRAHGGMLPRLVAVLVAEVLVIAAVLSIAALAWVATRTRLGVGLRATVTDAAMAESFGVDKVRVRTATFLVASALAGVSGLLVGMLNNLVEPGMGGLIAYKGLAIIVLGGLGSVSGTLAASLLFGLIESFGTVMLDKVMDRDAVAFVFMLLMLLIRPQGLMGKAR